MNRGFGGRVSSRVLAVLCSLFLLVAPAFAQSAASCPDRTAALFYVDDSNWGSDLLVTSTTGATVRVSDCSSFSVFTQAIGPSGSLLVTDFAGNLCSRSSVGIAHLPVKNGCATLATEATFRDGSTVLIPELAPPLRASAQPSSGRYVFDAIENGAKRSTFFALLTEEGSTRVTLSVYDGAGKKAGSEIVDVEGFVWYELVTRVDVGRVELQNTPVVVGPYTPASVYAMAFVGSRDRGSARAVAPGLAP